VTSRVKRRAALFLSCVAVALAATSTPTRAASVFAQAPQENSRIQVGQSYHNDVSPALRDLPMPSLPTERNNPDEQEMRKGNLNPQLPLPPHTDIPDSLIDHSLLGLLVPE